LLAISCGVVMRPLGYRDYSNRRPWHDSTFNNRSGGQHTALPEAVGNQLHSDRQPVLSGMPSLRVRDSAGGRKTASLPTITIVEVAMRDNDALVSVLLSDLIAARATNSGV
jgi:hypothetical protein